MDGTTTMSSRKETPDAREKDQGQGEGGVGGGGGTCTVLLFASAATYTGGTETLTLPAPATLTLRGVFSALEDRFPGFTAKVLRSAAVTVNLDYVDFEIEDEDQPAGPEHGNAAGGVGSGLDLPIRPGDEVGIIPPVSSG